MIDMTLLILDNYTLRLVILLIILAKLVQVYVLITLIMLKVMKDY